jgi:hypothetical protein
MHEASETLSTNAYYVWRASNATTAGFALTTRGVTGGKVNLNFGLAHPIGYGAGNIIQVADGAGGVTSSGWQVTPSILGLTDVANGANFFATQFAGVGLGGVFRIYDTDLTNTMDLGPPANGFDGNYRFNYPPTRLGAYQTWTSTGPAGLLGQLQNTTVIVSTSGLQPGATFWVSVSTVATRLNAGSIQFPDGTIQISSPTHNPVRDFWFPASGSQPIEPFNDSIASLALSTGTTMDSIVADFDSATDECRGYNIGVPPEIDTSTSVIFTVIWYSSATSGSTVWYTGHNSGVSQGQTVTNAYQTHVSTVSAAQSSSGQLTFTSWDIAVSSLTWAADEQVDGTFCRDGNSSYGTDSMVGDARATAFRIRIPIR